MSEKKIYYCVMHKGNCISMTSTNEKEIADFYKEASGAVIFENKIDANDYVRHIRGKRTQKKEA